MLKIDDKKFSKSRGNVIWVKDDYLDEGLHPDLLRYYLASYTAHNKEVNFAWNIFADKVNSELVGAFGNFINRALTFSVKNFDGKVPEGKIDADVLARIEETMAEVVSGLEEYEFKKATDSVMTLADYGNTYFQSHEPWKLVKSDKECRGLGPAKLPADRQSTGNSDGAGHASKDAKRLEAAGNARRGQARSLFKMLLCPWTPARAWEPLRSSSTAWRRNSSKNWRRSSWIG